MRKYKVGENHLAIIDENLNRAGVNKDVKFQTALARSGRRVENPCEVFLEPDIT